jgi:DNA-binding CsgD family transcriptional regulator
MKPAVSDREVDFLERLGRGETTRDIADAWHMEMTSIWTVAERLRRKLGAKTNEQAVLLACRAGLLDGRPQRHGDHAGFVAHTRRREPPCDACAEGELAYQAERRQIRRQQQDAA